MMLLPESELRKLDEKVQHALETGDESGLDVLGYGEISCVLAYQSDGRSLALKRLPPFRDAETFAAYRECFELYFETLVARGVKPLSSRLQSYEEKDGSIVAWCVQPLLPGENLLSTTFHDCPKSRAIELFERVLGAIVSCVGPTFGLDGQLSNWILDQGEVRYLDVTTPLLRTASGRERLPVEVFLASLPWALRSPVRRFMLRDILDKYYDPRGVVLDLLGNMYKERLDALLPPFLERANASVRPALSAEEARRYYADDARTWALLQRLRRADRWWQKSVRRRAYPFLLPGKIER